MGRRLQVVAPSLNLPHPCRYPQARLKLLHPVRHRRYHSGHISPRCVFLSRLGYATPWPGPGSLPVSAATPSLSRRSRPSLTTHAFIPAIFLSIIAISSSMVSASKLNCVLSAISISTFHRLLTLEPVGRRLVYLVLRPLDLGVHLSVHLVDDLTR